MKTLVEAAKLSNDMFERGIIETLIERSPVLSRLKFGPMSGNAYQYRREATLPTANFYRSGDTWVESSGTVSEHSAALTILGGDIDVDNFINDVLSNINDQTAEAMASKAKAMARTFDDEFIYGSVSANAKAIDGLHAMVDSTQQIHQGSSATGAALSLKNLDKAIALVKRLDNPSGIIMNETTRRNMSAYYRAAGASFHMERGEDGQMMEYYGKIPILIDDFITQTETISGGAYSTKTGGACSSLFVVAFGDKMLKGLQNGGIRKEKIGTLETKDATRYRFKWYLTWALENIYALSRIDGITDATAAV